MTTLRVWAPNAATLDVVTDAGRSAMRRADGGWWTHDTGDDPTASDYRFVVDDGDPRPDPRSAWQPHGVHGASRPVDHGAFPWQDAAWRGIHLPSAVLYELHVGTFSAEGTFDGVAAHLDHVVSMGVDAIELLPVAEFSGERGWGYDGVDLYAPHHSYGGPDGLKRLVDACHRRGLGVIIDVVYNHLGPVGNYLAGYGPYFTERHHTPWGPAVNLDGPGSDEVRAFLIDNAVMWLEDYHADGLRLDAVHAIFDSSAVHFLEELASRVGELSAATGRDLAVIAESDLNDPRLVRAADAGGYGLHAQWSDDFHHAVHAVVTGERAGYYADFGTLADVASALVENFVYAGRHSVHRGRRHGRSAAGLPGWRFVGYLQNHDQVGNRARGDRLTMLASGPRARVAAGLLLLSPFVPMLFQGEEWAASTPFQYFTDHADAEVARSVSEGRRRECGAVGWDVDTVPDPQDPATFERSVLRWEEIGDEPHASMLQWYRQLIAMRRAWPELRNGRVDWVRADDDRGVLTFGRGRLVVAVNLGARQGVTVPDGAGDVLLASTEGVGVESGSDLVLPADSLGVIGPAR